jgi:hypothetical protein
MNVVSKVWPPPFLLARKVLCAAYTSAPFCSQTASKFQGLHACAALRVIARHLKMGFRLDSIEKSGAGFRIDLAFAKPSVGSRMVEVKSANKIREVHKLQAALYPNDQYNEIAVSNRHEDIILDPAFIYEARTRAQRTLQLLNKDPKKAAVSYMPHEDICYTCANSECPFLLTSKHVEPQRGAN